MRRKYEGSTIQRRHPGMAELRPEAWRLEEERGAVLDCRCPECLAIRQGVLAELQIWERRPRTRRARNRPYRNEPRVIPYAINYRPLDWGNAFNGVVVSANDFADTLHRLAYEMGTAFGGFNDTSGDTLEANQRAEALLAALLTDEQYESWRVYTSFTITVPSGNRYELHDRSTYRLDEAGRKIASYCLISRQPLLPIADLVASRLLLLQANEELFLRLANGRLLPDSGNVTWTTGAWQPIAWNHG